MGKTAPRESHQAVLFAQARIELGSCAVGAELNFGAAAAEPREECVGAVLLCWMGRAVTHTTGA